MNVEMEENGIPRILETREAAIRPEMEEDRYDILKAVYHALKGKQEKWYSRETALREENRTLQAALDDESRRLTSAETDLEDRRGSLLWLEEDLDAALIDAKEVRRQLAESQGLREAANACVNSSRIEVIKLQTKLDSAQLSERHFAASECKRRRLENEKKLKLDEAHKQELDQVQRESKKLRAKLALSLKKTRKLETDFAIVKTKLEDDLLSSGIRLDDVEKNRQSLQKNLEEEKERSLCQICFENPKDSIVFPCLHLNFCFSCLEADRIRTGACPTCRVAISGVLKCVLC